MSLLNVPLGPRARLSAAGAAGGLRHAASAPPVIDVRVSAYDGTIKAPWRVDPADAQLTAVYPSRPHNPDQSATSGLSAGPVLSKSEVGDPASSAAAPSHAPATADQGARVAGGITAHSVGRPAGVPTAGRARTHQAPRTEAGHLVDAASSSTSAHDDAEECLGGASGESEGADATGVEVECWGPMCSSAGKAELSRVRTAHFMHARALTLARPSCALRQLCEHRFASHGDGGRDVLLRSPCAILPSIKMKSCLAQVGCRALR